MCRQIANPATLADHDGQSMPSRQSAARAKKSIAEKSPRSIVAGSERNLCYIGLSSLPSRSKDVIELLLLPVELILFI